MCDMEPNLLETLFFLELNFLLKATSLRCVKHRSQLSIHIFSVNLRIGLFKARNTSLNSDFSTIASVRLLQALW